MIDDRTLQEVLQPYGLAPSRPDASRALGSGSGNRVYAVSTTTGTVVVRQSHPSRTRQWLELEAAVLQYLACVNFPAVRQRVTLAGQPFIEREGTFWAAFEHVDADLAVPPNDAQLATLARLQAGLHEELVCFPAAELWASWTRQPRPRKTWACIVPLADTLAFLNQLNLERRLSESLPGPFAGAAIAPIHQGRLRLEGIVRQLPDLPGMLTHYDYGQYNVLFAADGPATVIDFDLLCWESPAANLARALSVVARRQWMGPFEPSLAAAYLAAYESERSLTDSERTALPGLLRLFVLQYVIFHALLCIEEFKAAALPDERWVQAMRDDLQRDDELAASADDYLK
jgi:Ser/Thr protein kinase RdoA (MazF antagonist)